MKKGEAVRRIDSGKHIADNDEFARYGVYAKTKALEALLHFYMMRKASISPETIKFWEENMPKVKIGKFSGSQLILLEGMELFIEALENGDDGFFDTVAEIIRHEKAAGFPTSPDWAKFTAYIDREEQKIRWKMRASPIESEEVAIATGLTLKRISEMASDCGKHLKGKKRGPKPTKKSQ